MQLTTEDEILPFYPAVFPLFLQFLHLYQSLLFFPSSSPPCRICISAYSPTSSVILGGLLCQTHNGAGSRTITCEPRGRDREGLCKDVLGASAARALHIVSYSFQTKMMGKKEECTKPKSQPISRPLPRISAHTFYMS